MRGAIFQLMLPLLGCVKLTAKLIITYDQKGECKNKQE